LAILAASVFLTSCEQETFTPEQISDTEILQDESKTYIIEVPDGLTGEAAVEWASQQPIEQYREISNEESETTSIESRWCYTYYSGWGFRGGTCICQNAGPSQGLPHCMRYCDIYTKYCIRWIGGVYVVENRGEVLRNCSC